MRTHILLLTLLTLSLGACKKTETVSPVSDAPDTSFSGKTLEGNITENDTLRANTQYKLKGFVYVKPGAELFIEPGTIILGDKNSKSTLIVERGGRIIAEGNAQAPIIFTSGEPEGSRNYGDWGGIILCGKAPVNLPGGEGLLEGGTGASFGGNDPDDNSGILKFVRIEFGGIAFQPNNEINGLTLGAVGRSTIIENIQVSYSGDDGFEWFGGTVNAKNLISFRNWDDDFDTDNGFSGNVQFGIILRDPNVADQSGSNGFESDNDGQGTDAAPFTSAVFSNISIIGPVHTQNPHMDANYRRAIHVRRNSKLSVFNSLLAGFPTGILLDGSKCEANAQSGSLNLKNITLAGCTEKLKTASGSTWDFQTWFQTSSAKNQSYSDYTQLGLPSAWNLNQPVLHPESTSALHNAADFTHVLLQNSFFQPVNYQGAMGTQDWTQGWAEFDPQNRKY